MSFLNNPSNRLPHALRFIIFLLRLAFGLDFLYLGLGTLFDQNIRRGLEGRSLGDLYGWLASVSNANSLQTIFAWAFLILGALLILGLFTRLAAILGIALTALSFFPALTFPPVMPLGGFNVAGFVSDGVIAILCLLILLLANAGTYLGLDMFFRLKVGKHVE